MLRALVILLFFAILPLGAQDGAVLHKFTDKKGQEIVATLLDITEDNRSMLIRRADGIEFETQINVLSLDDQQFIKNWLETRVVEVKTDYRLEIDINRKALNTERHDRDEYYEYEQRFSQYEFTVRNLSRETLPEAVLEYVIVWEENLRVYERDDGTWSYTYSSSSTEDPTLKITGKRQLSEMRFNMESAQLSEEFEINRMHSGGDIYREDELVGVIVRVVNPDGVVLKVEGFGSVELERMPWEQALAIKDAPKSE
tara:strand:+ start:219 stop:986 length:768 start_codon:yes stop_codon:yes gene_type:complete